MYQCFICGASVNRKPKGGRANVFCSRTCLRERRRQVGKKNHADGKMPRVPMSIEARKASSARMTGAGCPKFNGYRTKNSAGYILVRPPDGYNGPINKRGYIREHRLVMEQYLGRLLTGKEVVHHKNGIKDDNRIENLELVSDNATHNATHTHEALFNRWPKCRQDCGKQAKPYMGIRYLDCATCRRTIDPPHDFVIWKNR
jgi:hypothetical protein